MPPILRTAFTTLSLVCALWVSFVASVAGDVSEGQRKIEYLLESLESERDFKVRIAAANTLGKVADGSVADWMLRSFRKERNPAVRLSIIYAIGQIPDHRIISPLIHLAQNELLSNKELIGVERVLWNIRSAIHQQSWLNILIDTKKQNLRSTSAWLLGITGSASTIPVLQASLANGTPQVRMRAIQAIGRLGGERARSVCSRVARRDSSPRVKNAAKICLNILNLKKRGKSFRRFNHRMNTKVDLRGLRTNSMTPKLYLSYLGRNVNEDPLENAVAFLRPEQAEIRQDKSIRLVSLKDFKNAYFRLDVDVISVFRFAPTDVARLQRRIRERAPELNQCYITRLKAKPKLQGKILIQFRIAQSGRVSKTRLIESSLGDSTVHRCLQKKVSQISFPEIPMDHIDIRYAMSFTPPKEEVYKFTTSDQL